MFRRRVFRNSTRNVSFPNDNVITSKDSADDDNGYYMPPPSGSRPIKPSPSMATLCRLERQKIVLWRRPIRTLNFFVREIFWLFAENVQKLLANKRLLFLSITLACLLTALYSIPGPHSPLFAYVEKKAAWCTYWIFLGVLSSVGLGTGLHTFLLYLGPHIASVTLAAYECQSLKFPEPPYPDEIVCPYGSNNGDYSDSVKHVHNASQSNGIFDAGSASIGSIATASSVISLWAIMSKVRLEAFMWGAGTALGELPPYFMAKAARVSGDEPDDEEYKEFLQFMKDQEAYEKQIGKSRSGDFWHKVKSGMQYLIESVGFLGILLCASVPNPLFDLAGITCGHFLVPFWTFFGATLLGKAVIKMHIQKLFVILAFSEHHVDKCVQALEHVPKVGPYLQKPFKDLLSQQKVKFHAHINGGKQGLPAVPRQSVLQRAFEVVFVGMVVYFVVSLVNSLAQNYDRRVYLRQKNDRRSKIR